MNPEEGYIATANNEVIDDAYPYHITNIWAQPYRYERIVEMIETPSYDEDTGELLKLTASDMKAMQMDRKIYMQKSFYRIY